MNYVNEIDPDELELIEQFHDAGIWLDDERRLSPPEQHVHREMQKRGLAGSHLEFEALNDIRFRQAALNAAQQGQRLSWGELMRQSQNVAQRGSNQGVLGQAVRNAALGNVIGGFFR